MAASFSRYLYKRARNPLWRLAHCLSFEQQVLRHSWHNKVLTEKMDVHQKFMQQVCVPHTKSFHTSSTVHKERIKFEEEKFECVNIYSPTGTVISEGQPLIYLDRLCKYFPCYTYTGNDMNSSNNSANPRNFKLERKKKMDEPELKKSSNQGKGPRKIVLSTLSDSKSLKKLQNLIVDSGEALLVLKPVSRKQKRTFELEQNVKEIMGDFCTFSHVKSEQGFISTFELRRKNEDDDYYKALFTFIYNREKKEVDLMIDCAKTIRSFSKDNDEKTK